MKIMKELVHALYEYLMMLPVTTVYSSAQGVIEPSTSTQIAHTSLLPCAILRDDARAGEEKSSSISRAEDISSAS